MEIHLAVIGGTGVYALPCEHLETHDVTTPYGHPSGPLRIGRLGDQRVAFLARHGEQHSVPPHRINYRANIAALKQAGAVRILALNTVGGITEHFPPRTLACPEQLIDYTSGRIGTFGEEPGNEIRHIDFTHPYTPVFRHNILAAARATGVPVTDGGCYAATQGPRLETAAEIVRLRRDGCDIVGMTGMPEAALARELDLEYASLAIIANWAAGCGNGQEITMTEVLENVAAATAGLPEFITELARA